MKPLLLALLLALDLTVIGCGRADGTLQAELTVRVSEKEYEGKPASHWVAMLGGLGGSPDAKSRLAAVRAVGALGPEARAAVPGLIECLGERLLRSAAAFALGEMGAEARAAAPVLISALVDEDEQVRASAAAALTKLGSAAVPDLLAAVQRLDEASAPPRPSKTWFDQLVDEQPTIVAAGLVIVLVVAILASLLALVLWMRHRERLARIEKCVEIDRGELLKSH